MSEHHHTTDQAATENSENRLDRRRFLKAGAAGAVGAAAAVGLGAGNAIAATADDPYADPANPALPPSDMKLDFERLALVITDPQIDFLEPERSDMGRRRRKRYRTRYGEEHRPSFRCRQAGGNYRGRFAPLLLSDGSRLEVRGSARKAHA